MVFDVNHFTITRSLDAPVDRVWPIIGNPGASPGRGVDVRSGTAGSSRRHRPGPGREGRPRDDPRGDHRRRPRSRDPLPHDQGRPRARLHEQRGARGVPRRRHAGLLGRAVPPGRSRVRAGRSPSSRSTPSTACSMCSPRALARAASTWRTEHDGRRRDGNRTGPPPGAGVRALGVPRRDHREAREAPRERHSAGDRFARRTAARAVHASRSLKPPESPLRARRRPCVRRSVRDGARSTRYRDRRDLPLLRERATGRQSPPLGGSSAESIVPDPGPRGHDRPNKRAFGDTAARQGCDGTEHEDDQGGSQQARDTPWHGRASRPPAWPRPGHRGFLPRRATRRDVRLATLRAPNMGVLLVSLWVGRDLVRRLEGVLVHLLAGQQADLDQIHWADKAV